MKKLISIIFCAAMMFASCSSNQPKEEENSQEKVEQSIEDTEKPGDTEVAKNCDEFIDEYEEWMDDYLELLEKYMKKPMDATLSQKFLEQSQKVEFWTTEWNSKLYECAAKEKYQKRFDEISDKADKKLEEMGL